MNPAPRRIVRSIEVPSSSAEGSARTTGPLAAASSPLGYPSLRAHLASRRQFLAGGAALVGSGLVAACARPLGTAPEDPPVTPPPEEDPPLEVDGGAPAPDYLRVRIPETDSRAVYLSDGGYARYFLWALTYQQDCALFVEDARGPLGEEIDVLVSECTYDQLIDPTGAGVDGLQETVRSALDDAYNEDTGDTGSYWFVAVELALERLDAPAQLGGDAAGPPAYP